MSYPINKYIALLVFPLLLQACGGEGINDAPNEVKPKRVSSSSNESSGFSDSVPLSVENALKGSKRFGAYTDSEVGIPRSVALTVIGGVTHITWQAVPSAGYYNIYIQYDGMSDFQLSGTTSADEVLKYPLDSGVNAYVTASVLGVESKASAYASRPLARKAFQVEHAVFD